MRATGFVVALALVGLGCGEKSSGSESDAALDTSREDAPRADQVGDGQIGDEASDGSNPSDIDVLQDNSVPGDAIDQVEADGLLDVPPSDQTLTDLEADLSDAVEDVGQDTGPDVPTVCQPGEPLCQDNQVVLCLPDGSGPGEVVADCDPNSGMVCIEGGCWSVCALASKQPSNAGCEFWAVDLDQQDAMNDPANAPWGIVLSNVGEYPATVTVEINEAPVSAEPSIAQVAQVVVQPGALMDVVLPTREVDCGATPNSYAAPGTCLSSQAYRITSTLPIVVYQFNVFENAYSNDASLLLPVSALGLQYRILGWGAGHPIPINMPGYPVIIDRSYVTIVGTQANTQVVVKPSWRIKGNAPIGATPAQGQVSVTIGPFDVLNLETDDGTMQDDTLTVADLSGTAIQASAPVAVFSGVESAGAPGGFDIPTYPGWQQEDTCCLDHLEEQVFPVEFVGSHYVVTRSPVRSTGSFHEADVIRFVGVAEQAVVTTSLPAPFNSFTLEPGQVMTTWAQENFVVESTKPVIVGQILVSGQYCEGAPVGDPSLTLMPSVEQFRTEYLVPTPGSWTQNWIVMANQVGYQLTIDGLPPANCISEPAGTLQGKSWESLKCPVTEGAHRILGESPFGIVVYGYGSAGSYAFAGGASATHVYNAPALF